MTRYEQAIEYLDAAIKGYRTKITPEQAEFIKTLLENQRNSITSYQNDLYGEHYRCHFEEIESVSCAICHPRE